MKRTKLTAGELSLGERLALLGAMLWTIGTIIMLIQEHTK
jgi:hypothetical protein